MPCFDSQTRKPVAKTLKEKEKVVKWNRSTLHLVSFSLSVYEHISELTLFSKSFQYTLNLSLIHAGVSVKGLEIIATEHWLKNMSSKIFWKVKKLKFIILLKESDWLSRCSGRRPSVFVVEMSDCSTMMWCTQPVMNNWSMLWKTRGLCQTVLMKTLCHTRQLTGCDCGP